MIEEVAMAIVVLAAIAVTVRDHLEDDLEPEEREQRRYARGEISLDELDRRLEVLADPEARRIRESVERISGIGEATSWTIAERFSSLEALRRADREELQEISNVGEQRAQALKERLS